MNVAIAASRPRPDVVRSLLDDLPEWFGIPEAVDQYVADSATMPTLLATDEAGEPVGVLVHRQHFPESVEIYVMAVARRRHRQGIGGALVDTLAAQASSAGARLTSVKRSERHTPTPATPRRAGSIARAASCPSRSLPSCGTNTTRAC